MKQVYDVTEDIKEIIDYIEQIDLNDSSRLKVSLEIIKEKLYKIITDD